ncbi:MAG TPA: alpha/beta hydrolase [Sediminibacterium sp.]|nr:alpha/beta hydrolase [Sediminibacterium sp.]
MKKQLYLLMVLGTISQLRAQSYAGITDRPDTSYTNFRAFQDTKKSYPAIQLVMPDSSGVHIQRNLVDGSTGYRSLFCDVFSPVSKPVNHIAILMIHGGGWRSGNRHQHDALMMELARRGYTCFTPEYRLSTEALFPAAIYDLKAAIRYIKQNGEKFAIDTTKIVCAGFSAGGELAAFLGVTGNMPLFEGNGGNASVPTNVQAVIDIDGILSFVHPESGEGDDSKHISAATYWFGYPKKGYEKLWEAASTLSYVNVYTPPTLFINSSVNRMHAGRDDYRAKLRELGIYTEVQSFKDAPHSFCLFHPWFQSTVTDMDQFIKKVFP